MRIFIIILLFLTGCYGPPITIEKNDNFIFDHNNFEISPNNSYAILLKGRRVSPNQLNTRVSNINHLQQLTPISDQFIDNDLQQLKLLTTNKKFDTYELDFLTHNLDDLIKLINDIKAVSDNNTRLLIGYSGEGTKTGLAVIPLIIGGTMVCTHDILIKPDQFYELFSGYQGKLCFIVNACHSGIFNKPPVNLKMVGIFACGEEYKTTPYEPYQTTAIYAGFIRNYISDPYQELELSELEISPGGFFNNILHKLDKIGKNISFDPVVYFNTKFKF